MAQRIVWTDQAKADIRSIEQPIAIQILKTLGRYVFTGEGATKQLKGLNPPLIRLRAQITVSFFAITAITLRLSACSTARTLTDNLQESPSVLGRNQCVRS